MAIYVSDAGATEDVKEYVTNAPARHLIFGGTFDPVHLGHIHVALAVCDAFGFHQCAFLPNACPAGYKSVRANVAQRRKMLEYSLSADPRFYLDDRELRRGGDSYTCQTLRELRDALGSQGGIFWLIGADAFYQLTSWHAWQTLFALTNFIVASRPGYTAMSGELAEYCRTRLIPRNNKKKFLQQPQGAVYMFDAIHMPVSATAIRRAVHNDKTIAQCLPAGIHDYIVQQRLYPLYSCD